MKLYGAPNPAPNPRRVRIFLAEKGIELPETPVDMRKREHKSPEFREKNPTGQIPVLELDDGRTLVGNGVHLPLSRGVASRARLCSARMSSNRLQIDMWIRRVEFVLMTPIGMFWRHAHPYTASLLTQFKDFGESNRETVDRRHDVVRSPASGSRLHRGRALFHGRYLRPDRHRLRRLHRPAHAAKRRPSEGLARPG